MKKWLLIGLRVVGILLIAHALMLIGADEISTLEAGGIRTIRSLERILSLYGANLQALQALPSPLSAAIGFVLSLPGWAVLGATGAVLMIIARARE